MIDGSISDIRKMKHCTEKESEILNTKSADHSNINLTSHRFYPKYDLL